LWEATALTPSPVGGRSNRQAPAPRGFEPPLARCFIFSKVHDAFGLFFRFAGDTKSLLHEQSSRSWARVERRVAPSRPQLTFRGARSAYTAQPR
jgi:hypothetical protein